jgi:hypothetical protein
VPSAVMQSRGSRDDRPRRSYGGDRRDEGGGREREEPREAPAPIAAQGTAAEGVVA